MKDIQTILKKEGLEGLAHELLEAMSNIHKPGITLEWRIATLAELLNKFKHLYPDE